ncbi:hypothetical protein RJ639_030699 [Escallonia herrerae]|uniref:DBC1/CARP1 catalytically inactive NUDIX hydrolase domain-containing protein n=1 Tax=Escallonia herrerae TaxID=1293975 RepID=A0AA88X937_9ASTE|nr:hypothetical protein RJ639_030699 [Escallonia herrerae]
MFSARGNNPYGQHQQQQQQPQQQQQQQFSTQSAYAQNLGADAASQLAIASRHSSMLGGAHYGGQYSSVYGSAALSSAQQVPPVSAKGAGQAALQGRSGYGSAMPDSPKFTSGDYVSSSSHGYAQKADQLFSDKISDYPSIDRRQYAERSGLYMGRDLQSEPVGFGHQHQADIYDRIDQASVLRQEQLLKAQSLQSASLDGGSRQGDYLATRGATIRRPAQELMSYGGRMEADARTLSMLSSTAYGGQHAPSILGAAPRGAIDDLAYAQSSSNPGYGVSLPPGRDYATGKGLHGTSHESDYSRIDERKDDRVYARELERREEERHRDRLRDREKDREREKERERERERDRERERERLRKRERTLEQREKDKDREHKRGPEIKRDRTPLRISRDRRGSSATKDGKFSRRESPRHEASHRRRSPVKEKQREYVCKVYSSTLVDVERDYLSIDKRYPRLFISPECSKVVVKWPRENLKLSIHTPVSFEHDFAEEEYAAREKVSSNKSSAVEPVKPECGSTVWNAKMILMSGLSQNSLDELSSDRSYDDRIPHFCNMLRFAILKKDNRFLAIGGPWDAVDRGDPSVDESSLVQTVVRYAKDVTQLDLKNCRHWNRFLEIFSKLILLPLQIHYDRLGKDGLFSHKEVTVIYVPDLSDCLPSLDTWRDQWFAHKKALAERQKDAVKEIVKHMLQKLGNEHEERIQQKLKEKKEVLKGNQLFRTFSYVPFSGGFTIWNFAYFCQLDKETETPKDLKRDDKLTKKETESSGTAIGVNKKEKDSKPKGNSAEKERDESAEHVEKKDGVEGIKDNNLDKHGQPESECVQSAAGSVQSGKKKTVKKSTVKPKVADKKDVKEDSAKQNDNLDEKDVGDKSASGGVTGQQEEPSANPAAVKTFMRKKPVKKGQVQKAAQTSDVAMKAEVASEKDAESVEGKSGSTAAVQGASVKTTLKKKIVKKVKKKVVPKVAANEGPIESAKDGDKDEKQAVQKKDETASVDNQGSEGKAEKKVIPKAKSKTVTPKKQNNVGNASKAVNTAGSDHEKEEMVADDKNGSPSKMQTQDDKQKVLQKNSHDGRERLKEREKSKDERESKGKDGKDDPRNKVIREVKEKKKPEEPPRHPGLFLQTKGGKDSKLRSLSLSLDSLLDYTDKDIEESTFELSLFAETLYEMLQYQMGCRLLTFLQKLRIKFVAKRNQRKREREEASEKESEKISSTKRLKTDDINVEIKSEKTETQDEAVEDDHETIVKEENAPLDEDVKVKPDDESGEDEDPEEDPEEDEEMPDVNPQHDLTNEARFHENVEKSHVDDKSEKEAGKEKDEPQETAKEISVVKPKTDADGKAKETKAKKEETPVEDMRLIIHNLGKFMSHRDVKELVQSALLESNTGRDDRILYNKLVKMTRI